MSAVKVYPYKAWILQPSFKPVEVTFTNPYVSYSYPDYGDLTDSGKIVVRQDIYESKESAISAGREKIVKQQSDLDKKQENIHKKHAALNKAAA